MGYDFWYGRLDNPGYLVLGLGDQEHGQAKKKSDGLTGGGHKRRLLKSFSLTLAVLVALSFVTLAVVGPTTEKAEAIAPIIVIGAVIVGAAIGDFVYNWLCADRDNAGMSTYDATDYVNWLAASLVDKYALVDGSVSDFSHNLDLMEYFFIRQAQYAARELYIAQDEAGTSKVYDQYYVMKESTINAQLAETYEWATKQYQALFDPYNELGTTLTGNFETAKYGLYLCSGGTNEYNTVSPSTPNSKVGFSEELEFKKYYWFNDTPEITYVCGYNAATFTMYNITGAAILTDSTTPGAYKHVTTEFPAGYYKFDIPDKLTGAKLYAKNTIPFLTSSIGSIFGFKRSSDPLEGITVPLFSPNDDFVECKADGTYLITCGAGTADWARLGFAESADTTTGTGFRNTSRSVDVKDMVHDLKALADKIKAVQVNANNFAQSYYNAIVASGDPGQDWGLPLMLLPDPSQMEGMSWEQIYALYVAYLQNAYEYYQDHADQMNDALVNISGESLKLKVRGAILNQTGVQICDNSTVWTPYITTADAHLELGYNLWNQGGYAIKWGSCTDLANFTQAGTVGIISLANGYKFYIQEMMYDNQTVSEVDLTVTTLRLTLVNGTTPPAPPGTLTDLDWIIGHWYYIAILGGIVCLMGAIATRNTPILAAGLVLIAAGAIGWFLAGDHSLLSWLNMEPSNLRAWLQGLR